MQPLWGTNCAIHFTLNLNWPVATAVFRCATSEGPQQSIILSPLVGYIYVCNLSRSPNEDKELK